MAIVEVRVINKPKWHGISGKESFSKPTKIRALYDSSTGKYATGLSEKDRARLEDATGFNLSSNFNASQAHEYWDSRAGAVVLEEQVVNIFKSENPIDEIKIKILEASGLVANSKREYDDGLFPEALFIISNEEQELEGKLARSSVRKQAIVASVKLNKTQKIELIQILLNESGKNQSDNWIEDKLDTIIELHANKLLNIVNRDNKKNSLHFMILDGIYNNVLREEGASIYYLDTQLGFDVESTIEFFEDKSNQKLKAQIMEKLI